MKIYLRAKGKRITRSVRASRNLKKPSLNQLKNREESNSDNSKGFKNEKSKSIRKASKRPKKSVILWEKNRPKDTNK